MAQRHFGPNPEKRSKAALDGSQHDDKPEGATSWLHQKGISKNRQILGSTTPLRARTHTHTHCVRDLDSFLWMFVQHSKHRVTLPTKKHTSGPLLHQEVLIWPDFIQPLSFCVTEEAGGKKKTVSHLRHLSTFAAATVAQHYTM